MIRIGFVCRLSHYDGTNGGTEFRTFDIEAPQVEAFLQEWASTHPTAVGVEVLPAKQKSP